MATMAPITIPAIAPPEMPEPDELAAVAEGLDVDVGKSPVSDVDAAPLEDNVEGPAEDVEEEVVDVTVFEKILVENGEGSTV